MNYDVLEGYGVTLKRLTEDKIELVRRWRNDPMISQYMEYREYITAEQQLNWFQKINNDNNYYYLVCIDDKEIGLINIRDIDYATGEGEPGFFIWDDEYLNSDISFRSIAVIEKFAFEQLGLNKLIIHVLSDNRRAIKFNLFFGYKISKNQENVYNQEYTLVKENYKRYLDKLNKILGLN